MFHNSLRRSLSAFVFASLLLIQGCGGDVTTPPADDDDTVTITLTSGLRFSSANLTIDPGTTVRWVNNTSLTHTVTPNNPTQPGVWARAVANGVGTVLTHTFTVSGEVYSYFCEPHQADGMVGTITVR